MTAEHPEARDPNRNLRRDLPDRGTRADELTVAEALAIAQLKSECNSQTRKIRRARQYEEIPDDA